VWISGGACSGVISRWTLTGERAYARRVTYLAFALRRGAVSTSLVSLALIISACSNSDAASDPYMNTGGLSGMAESGDPSGSADQAGDGDGDGDGDEEMPVDDLANEDTSDCDVWLQDCPAGQKCSWELVDGAARQSCVPLDPEANPPGEPCTMYGDPGSGHDDCELGAICSWLDDNNVGVCLALCQGSPEDPSCEGVGMPALCQPCPDCPSLCVPTCNPLLDECGPGYACTPNAGDFTCLPAGQLGEGGLGAPCEYSIQCQAGFGCIDAASVPGCEAAGCCSPFCDLGSPECPPGMSCMAWFEGLDMPPVPDLGVCVAG
jgi:hypothetical protein